MNREFGIFLNRIYNLSSNIVLFLTILMLMFCLIMVTSELITISEGEKPHYEYMIF